MLCQNMKRQIVSRAFYGCKYIFPHVLLRAKVIFGTIKVTQKAAVKELWSNEILV